MILDETQAIAIVTDRAEKVPDWVTSARSQSATLKALIDGEDFIPLLINQIEHVETEKKALARKKYSRNITDLYERLLLPISNVFNSTGGSKKYFLEDLNKVDAERFINLIANIKGRKSVESYLETVWMPLYHTDPNGCIFMEYQTFEDKDAEIYPTYKSITTIRDYTRKGQLTDWILFEPVKTKDSDALIWRLVDDKTDWFIKQTGTSFVVMDKTFEHPFGEVPAIINSDIININTNVALSPVRKVVELSEEYARDQSVKTLYKIGQGFPIHWRYVTHCKSCTGSGKKNNGACPECNGKGIYQKSDVTDVVTLPAPTKTDQIKIAPDLAGFISTDLEYLKSATTELQFLEIKVQDTHWGTHVEPGNNETATGRFIDVQPVKNRLGRYSDVAEYMEAKMTELIANFVFVNKKKEQKVATIGYGRRFIIDTPDTLIEKYTTSKVAGENATVLDRMFNEYLVSKYKNDPEWLRIEQAKSKVEPYLHQTLKEVSDIFGRKEAQRKVFFKMWWEINEETLNLSDIESMRTKFNTDFDSQFIEPVEIVNPIINQ
jgi:hypothetical protein